MGRTFRDMINHVQKLHVPTVAEIATEQTAAQIAILNRLQLESGFDSNGKRLRPYRNAKYARKKNQMNSKPGLGNPDFKLTGAFYRGIRAEVENGKVHTYSTDPKEVKLVKRDSSDIYGLSATSSKIYIEDHLRPAFMQQIKQRLKL